MIITGQNKAYIYIAHITEDYYKIGWSMIPKQRVLKLGLKAKDIVHLIEAPNPVWAETVVHTYLDDNWRLPAPEHVQKMLLAGRGEVYQIDDEKLAVLKSIDLLNRSTLCDFSHSASKLIPFKLLEEAGVKL